MWKFLSDLKKIGSSEVFLEVLTNKSAEKSQPKSEIKWNIISTGVIFFVGLGLASKKVSNMCSFTRFFFPLDLKEYYQLTNTLCIFIADYELH